MFFVAPFFFVALAWWIEQGLPRPRAAGVCAAVAAALVGVVPYSDFVNGNATSDTLAIIPLWTLQDTITTLDEVDAVVAAFAIAMILLLLLLPARLALVVPAAVLVTYAVALQPIEANPHGGIQHASVGALYGGTSKPDRDWIDAQLGQGTHVAVLFDSRTMDKFTVWTNEFFNRSLRTVYDLDQPAPGALPETKVRVDAATGHIGGVKEPYVLTARAVQLNEPVILRDDQKGLVVYRVVRPLGVTSVSNGIYADSWTGPSATYRRFDCRTGQTLAVTLGGELRLIRHDSTVTATSGGVVRRVTVPAGGTAVLRIPLRATNARCVVRFHTTPVAVPAAVEPGSTDTRVLGIRFLDARVR